MLGVTKGDDFLRIMAVDLGRVRTGLAICDKEEILASPIGTLTEGNPEKVPEKVAAVAAGQKAEMIVVGNPKNMDGSSGESAQRAAAFAARLEELTGLPVRLWDERMTTVSAIGFLNETDVRGKKRKAVVDTVSASIILENFLQHRKNTTHIDKCNTDMQK